jgi:hypothetical protein
MLKLDRYSIGVGDRFAHQAGAQLRACQLAGEQGVEVIPVWNKSFREHTTIGSEPVSVRMAADAAVAELGWRKPYHVDADHIRLETVDWFMADSDFFTIDVADSIGRPADADLVRDFVARHPELVGGLCIRGIDHPVLTTTEDVERIAAHYLEAVQDASELYRYIVEKRGSSGVIAEVSMDETDQPQTPLELLVILAALADEGVQLQTIAPKFTGRFNKGVDYVGDLARFSQEFQQDIAVIAHAAAEYELPANLKLSVHSGSDKFSLYPLIHRTLQCSGAGLHLKTAGTTWLEEIVGLAEAGGEGLDLAQEIYEKALARREALCAPYAAVIDIDPSRLPSAETVRGWSSEEFTAALRHNPACSSFNPHLRQLLHVGYKIAAELGDCYLRMLESCEEPISRNVTRNLFERHIKPVFVG